MASYLRRISTSTRPINLAIAFLLMCFVVESSAQVKQTAGSASKQTVRALFISDIHFDPFHDPGKARQLESAPATAWEAILSSAGSADQQQAFDALQQRCHAKGVDTPPALLRSVVTAMKAQAADAKFMMVSGDLIVHDFTCRYQTLFPNASPGAYQAFVLKTVSYVLGELRGAFPGTPVYAALGNNDSGCVDYQLDPNGDFFASGGGIIASGLPEAERQSAKKEFAAEGNYSVTMAAPMKNTRLIVLDDTFLSPKYKTCAGKKDSTGPDEEIAWLKSELAEARRTGQRVWVMAHIPLGIDPYSTASKFRDICGGQDPVMFLSSDKIPDLMVEYSDVVKLGVFAHTHMDEIRLLRPEAKGATGAVAVKMIPSVSPVHGNNPSFTIASINPVSASMLDYTVVTASNLTGIDTKWTTEYNYASAYHQTDFSPAALNSMIDKFHSDNSSALPESQNYLRSYFPGNRAALLSPFWMQYTCALNNYTGKGYAACVCRTGN
jgi:sphingomyelin phosphodiesterase acid-like 3